MLFSVRFGTDSCKEKENRVYLSSLSLSTFVPIRMSIWNLLVLPELAIQLASRHDAICGLEYSPSIC